MLCNCNYLNMNSHTEIWSVIKTVARQVFFNKYFSNDSLHMRICAPKMSDTLPSTVQDFIFDFIRAHSTSLSPATERRLHQSSVVLTWTEDRHFPALWKSGVTNMSVRLLHTTWTDGRSITTLWMAGITNLVGQGQRKVTNNAVRRFHKMTGHLSLLFFKI